ncbi:MAG: hypothetical protein U0X40_09590 [Ferruginibacter sp.]
MEELDDHIKRINGKLQQFLKQHRQLQKDNERQSRLIAELQKAKEEDRQLIQQLKEQVAILKSATGQLSGTDKTAFEKTISQYIKEIDKCIGLLSE